MFPAGSSAAASPSRTRGDLDQTSSNWTSDNFNHQPTINLSDLADVLNNFGQSNSDPTIPTPEPASLTLLVAVTALFIANRRSRSFLKPPKTKPQIHTQL